MVDIADNLLVDLTHQHHLHHIHGLAVRDPHALDITGLNLEAIEQEIDLRPAAMDNHRINPDMLHQDHIEGKLFFQILIHHGVAAVLDHHRLMAKGLHIRERLDEHLGPFNAGLHRGSLLFEYI